MTPFLASALGGLLTPAFILAVLALAAIFVVRAYDPAGDVLAAIHKTTSYLKTPTDGLERLLVDFTPDDEYPAGGYTSIGLAAHATGSLTALQLEAITWVEGFCPTGYLVVWNRATGKLMFFEAGADAAPLDEVTAGTDLSALECTLKIYGVRDYSNA